MAGAPEPMTEYYPDLSASSRECALEELAKFLHWKQWNIDPPPGESDCPSWGVLSEFERDFYRSSVEALLENVTLIRAAMSSRP
jgi:hypothetical protein